MALKINPYSQIQAQMIARQALDSQPDGSTPADPRAAWGAANPGDTIESRASQRRTPEEKDAEWKSVGIPTDGQGNIDPAYFKQADDTSGDMKSLRDYITRAPVAVDTTPLHAWAQSLNPNQKLESWGTSENLPEAQRNKYAALLGQIQSGDAQKKAQQLGLLNAMNSGGLEVSQAMLKKAPEKANGSTNNSLDKVVPNQIKTVEDSAIQYNATINSLRGALARNDLTTVATLLSSKGLGPNAMTPRQATDLVAPPGMLSGPVKRSTLEAIINDLDSKGEGVATEKLAEQQATLSKRPDYSNDRHGPMFDQAITKIHGMFHTDGGATPPAVLPPPATTPTSKRAKFSDLLK